MASERPIIIKKVKKVAGGHHGGAWKVAYADFVTAMMAFFLLMWLINTTSPEQKRGIADYFAPASVAPTTSGSGGILAGTDFGEVGVRQKGAAPLVQESQAAPTQPSPDGEGTGASTGETTSESQMSAAETAQFEQASVSLRQALQDLPELAELSKHVITDITPEGLRIQLVDQDGGSMFDPGSTEPNQRARLLLQAVARIAVQLPNKVTISGHTDAGPNPNPSYTNWELSADRANGARRVLQQAGLDPDRIYQVAGKAGSEPLFIDDPYAAPNRRITVVLMRAAAPLPTDHSL
mgnify:CR=1 FL=1